MKGRGTADGMYVLRQMVEKILDVQGIWLWGPSIWTKKPLTQYPEMAMLRWMGVPEAEVWTVEGVYEKTTERVVVGDGASEEFDVKMDSARAAC